MRHRLHSLAVLVGCRWRSQLAAAAPLELCSLSAVRYASLLAHSSGALQPPNLISTRSFASEAVAAADVTRQEDDSSTGPSKRASGPSLGVSAAESRAHHLMQQGAFKETAELLLGLFQQAEDLVKAQGATPGEIRSRHKLSRQLFDLLTDALYRLHAQRHKQQQQQQPVSAGAIVSMLERASRLQRLFGFPLHTRQYNVLIECSGSGADALQHYEAMMRPGSSARPSATTHLLLAKVLVQSDLLDEALSHLRQAQASEALPPRMRAALQGTQVRALRRCISAGRAQQVEALLGEMLAACTEPGSSLSMADVPSDVFMDSMCLAAEAGMRELFSVCLSLLESAQRQVVQPGGRLSSVPAKLEQGKLLYCLATSARAGDLLAAQRLFELAAASRHQPNYHPWSGQKLMARGQQQQAAEQPTAASMQDAAEQQQQLPAAVAPAAYHSLIAAHLAASPNPDLGATFELVAEMQRAHPGLPRLVSPFAGLAFMSQALNSEDLIAGAYATLSERQKAGGEVSTAMWNVVLRALALLGNLPATSKMFESYAQLGAQHDVDSYNAVVEACVRLGKLPAAQRLVDYMGSQFVAADRRTHELLCEGHLAAADPAGLLRAAVAAKKAGTPVPRSLLERGVDLAKAQGKLAAADGLRGELVQSAQLRAGRERERVGPAPRWQQQWSWGGGQGQGRRQGQDQQPRAAER